MSCGLSEQTWRRAADRVGFAGLFLLLIVVVSIAVPSAVGQILFENQKMRPAFPFENSRFGFIVRMNNDLTLVSGGTDPDDPEADAVYVYRLNPDTQVWREDARLLPIRNQMEDDNFGNKFASAGNFVVVGAKDDSTQVSGAGAVYVFRYDEDRGNWRQQSKLYSPDPEVDQDFGKVVSAYSGPDGDVVAVSAPFDNNEYGVDAGAVYIYRFDDSTQEWVFQWKIEAPDGSDTDQLGDTIALGDDVVFATAIEDDEFVEQGTVYVFRRIPGSRAWQLETKLIPSDGRAGDYFGETIAWNGEDAVAVGARGSDDAAFAAGAVYVFRYDDVSGTWFEEAKLIPRDAQPGDTFGKDVAFEGDWLVGSAPLRDRGNAKSSGAAFSFRFDRSSGVWVEDSLLQATDSQADDRYGGNIAIAGDWMVAGAWGHDEFALDGGAIYFHQFRSPRLYVSKDGLPAGNGRNWNSAFRRLTAALDAARDNPFIEEIWVQNGVYRPDEGTGDRTLAFELVDGVAVYGGFVGDELNLNERDPDTNLTVLDGDLRGNDRGDFANFDDNAYNVVRAVSVGDGALLDGFVIRGGNAVGSPAPYDRGGGISIRDRSNPTIRNVTLTENRSLRGGAAIHVHFRSEPLIEDCLILDHESETEAGGAISSKYNSSPTILNCRIIGSRVINGNGGAISQMYGGMMIIRDTIITGNTAGDDGGALFAIDAAVDMVNVAMMFNRASASGVASLSSAASLLMTNCSMGWNEGTDAEVGVIHNIPTSHVDLLNSIVFDNYGRPSLTGDGTRFVAWSNVEGGAEGDGNINLPPVFEDPAGPDRIPGTEDDHLRVLDASPVIDAGNNGFVPLDISTDIAGNARMYDDPGMPDTGTGSSPIVDMGAWEFNRESRIFEITMIEPGEAGTRNRLSIKGAVPFAEVTVVYGFEPGETRVLRCDGLFYGIESADVLERVSADADGNVSVVFWVPGGVSGRTIYLQASEESCRVTNLFETVFN
ncbi:MAG: right-handed parallel beta-helix repeat-containing protein [Planctomycetota bacterium]